MQMEIKQISMFFWHWPAIAFTHANKQRMTPSQLSSLASASNGCFQDFQDLSLEYECEGMHGIRTTEDTNLIKFATWP